jgi:Zn-dependent protease
MRFTGTVQIARLFDIPVKLHWSFGLLLLYVLYISYSNDLSFQATIFFAAFILCLFICVVLHEFGHALMARRFDVQTQDIILLPIGGVARLTRLPAKPGHEFLIAVAGPLVNVVIAIILVIILVLSRAEPFLIKGDEGTLYEHFSNFLPLLLVLNITLVVFNMIPAFPMDGGRVLRALLSIKLGRLKATRIASFLGQVLALIFILTGIWNNHIILSFIGIFIFFSAGTEYKMVRTEQLLKVAVVGDIMRKNFTIIYSFDTADTVKSKMEEASESYFLVLNEFQQMLGVLSAEAFMLSNTEDQTNWLSLISQHSIVLDPLQPVREVLRTFKIEAYVLCPVMQDGHIIGVVDVNSFN